MFRLQRLKIQSKMMLLIEKNTLSLCMILKIVIIVICVQKIMIPMNLTLADSKIVGLIVIAIHNKKCIEIETKDRYNYLKF